VPLVVRLVGTNEEEGRRLLAQVSGITPAHSMEEGAETIVRLVQAAAA